MPPHNSSQVQAFPSRLHSKLVIARGEINWGWYSTKYIIVTHKSLLSFFLHNSIIHILNFLNQVCRRFTLTLWHCNINITNILCLHPLLQYINGFAISSALYKYACLHYHAIFIIFIIFIMVWYYVFINVCITIIDTTPIYITFHYYNIYIYIYIDIGPLLMLCHYIVKKI